MLVLSRKQNEEILIGDAIKLTILKVRGNTVRIGIEAPRDVRIMRGELSLPDELKNVTVEFKTDNSSQPSIRLDETTLEPEQKASALVPPQERAAQISVPPTRDPESFSRMRQLVSALSQSTPIDS